MNSLDKCCKSPANFRSFLFFLFLFFFFSSTSGALATENQSLSANYYYTLAVQGDGTVWAWGSNYYGQLGNSVPDEDYHPVPVQVSGLTGIHSVSAGSGHALAVQSDGTVWAWGYNADGQLGDGTTTTRSTPMKVEDPSDSTGYLSDVIAVAAGTGHSLALKADGTVWGWGFNETGQLGDGTLTSRLTPVQVVDASDPTGFLTDVTSISVGAWFSFAIKSDGTVWGWAENSYGQLGDGTTEDRFTPVRVGAAIDFRDVLALSSGISHTIALKTDGTVWAWGTNVDGKLGDGSTTLSTTPVQVSTLSGVVAVATGRDHSLALKSDGTVWAWGNNDYGQLGDSSDYSATPLLVDGLVGITSLSGGAYHALAQKSDGTLLAWGLNYYGEFGEETSVGYYTTVPRQSDFIFDVVAADFTATPTKGVGPLSVTFADASSGTPATRLWDFGDGATSTETNPVHEFATTGFYSITLTITANDGTVFTKSKNNYIVVTESDGTVPGSAYNFAASLPLLPQPWYFSSPKGLAMDDDGNIFVMDSWNNRVVKLTANGQFVSSFGSSGREDGQFLSASGVALDDDGNIYVTDTGFDSHLGDNGGYDYDYCRVQKFNRDGQFLSSWKNVTDASDVLVKPSGISVDAEGNLLVADSGNNRIVRYSPSGEYLASLDAFGSTPFSNPVYAKAGGDGFLYVVDYGNKMVHRFSSFTSADFVRSWEGTDDGTAFSSPIGLDVDSNGNLYVTDYYYNGNNRVVKIAADGTATALIDNGLGNGEGELYGPSGVVVDRDGNLIVGESWGHRINKFTTDGQYLTSWASSSFREGYFYLPHALAVDAAGNTYVADSGNYRIQKFGADGSFIRQWGSEGTGDGQFSQYGGHKGPHAIAIRANGDVLVADTFNGRIQIFDGDGNYIRQIGGLTYPSGLAIDGAGNVYVAEWSYSHQVKKFDPDWNLLATWGGYGSGDGQFSSPHGIAIDAAGYVYVADAGNSRIQKFDAEGAFVGKWGVVGADEGQLYQPWDVEVDSDGNIVVADTYNDRLQVFNPYGDLIAVLGGGGTLPGQFRQPQGIAIAPDGSLLVLENLTNRLQRFQKAPILQSSKAIIVAGGGPFPGNNLWNATRMNANYAYRTLAYQGFTKESIYYLSADTALDLDQNGLADDVDGDATNANLEQAISQWAADTENLVIYLVDHGGDGTFRMSGTETLSAEDLDAWLDGLQQQTGFTGNMVVVYDACESGTFVSALTPPAGYEDRRVVVAGTSPGESAYFIAKGAVSFSNYFWTSVFNGLSVTDSFALASESIIEYQTPLLDDNGNGVGNESVDGDVAVNITIGAGGSNTAAGAPLIGSVDCGVVAEDSSSATISASAVSDSDGIEKVWAIIRPPEYNQGAVDNPIQALPSISLVPTAEGEYAATYDGFNSAGTYLITIYARDLAGNTSVPELLPVSVANPSTRKAILVAAGSPADPLWPAMENNIRLAYASLRFQGYADADLYLVSAESISGVNLIPASPTVANMQYAVASWPLAGTKTQDLVLYMIGAGGNGTCALSATENLNATDLGSWLNILQTTMTGTVTVVYDGCLSGSFLPPLIPEAGQERILIAGSDADETAHFLAQGLVSFSNFFWRQVMNGGSVRDSFIHAKKAVAAVAVGQTPVLDDSGNGIGNEKNSVAVDGQLARYYTLGFGIMLAGDEPLISTVAPNATIAGTPVGEIWVDEVISTGTIAKVWAVITAPGFSQQSSEPVIDMPVVELIQDSDGRYLGEYDGFYSQGNYTVEVFAMDVAGNVSLPVQMVVTQVDAIDVYENDDTYDEATVIPVDSSAPQVHNFHDAGDADWFKFYALANEPYVIEIPADGASLADTVLDVFNADGVSQPATNFHADDEIAGDGEYLDFTPASSGIYYIRVTEFDGSFGDGYDYQVKVYRPIAGDWGIVSGVVASATDQTAVSGALLLADLGTALTLDDGSFRMQVATGTYTLQSTSTGFDSAEVQVEVVADQTVTVDLKINLEGTTDSDGDGVVDILDPFPADGAEWMDSDSDGVGNNADLDDDNDTLPDLWELANGLNSLDARDAAMDMDGDGISNLAEYSAGTDPQDGCFAISGRVMANDSPMANIWVEATSISTNTSFGINTDQDGFYRILVSPAMDYRVMVWSIDQYQTLFYRNAQKWEEANLLDLSAESVDGVDFVLQVGASIGGTVANLDQGELARIEAWSELTHSWGSVLVSGSGAGEVDFTIDGLVPAADYLINVWSANHAGGYLLADGNLGGWDEAVGIASGTTNNVIALAEARSISGTLSGLSIGDEVWVMAWDDTNGTGNSIKVTAVAGEASFVISGLAATSGYRLSICAEGLGSGFYAGTLGQSASALASWQEATLVDTSGSNQAGVNILLSSGVTISGTITGLADGDRARVDAWSESTGSWSGVSVVGLGEPLSYELPGLAVADDYRVAIEANGYRDGFYGEDGVSAWDNAALVSGSDNPTNIDFTLSQGTSISGTISGLAVGERIQIEAWSDAAWQWDCISMVGTGEPLGYTISGLAAADDYEVYFYPDNHVSVVVSEVNSNLNPTNINCVVASGNSIFGLISGAQAYEQITVHADSESSDDHASITVFADSLGNAAYELAGLSVADDYVVFAEVDNTRVFFDGVSGRLAGITMVSLTAGDYYNVDFVMDAFATKTISGAISGIESGSSVWVEAWDGGAGIWGGARPDPDGSFSFSLPLGGTYKIGIYGDGFEDSYYTGLNMVSNEFSLATAVTLSGDLALGTLTPVSGYTISGTLSFDADGDGTASAGDEKLAGIAVELIGGNLSKSVISNSQGYYQFTGVADGTYTLSVTSAYGDSEVDGVVGGADLVDKNILLSVSGVGEVAGTVTVGGVLTGDAVVKIFANNPVAFVNAVASAADGTFHYQGLVSGNYTVTVDINGDNESDYTDTAVVVNDGGVSVVNAVVQ